MSARMVENCPYRRVAAGRAHCGILESLSGLTSHDLTVVEHGACEACVETFPATETDPNLVVASLAVKLAENVERMGGVNGCSVETAVELRRFAEDRIPVLNPDEVDLVADASVCDSELSLEALQRLVPVPTRVANPIVSEWAVAVTTSPRRQPTVDACLDRLLSTGWNELLLSIDGDVQIDDRFQHMASTRRSSPIGAWPNYFLTLGELVMRSPNADAYMVVQDDSIFANCPQFKTYMESVLWPIADERCLVSLYCAADDSRDTDGWFEFSGQWKLGALAMVFSPVAARDFLSDQRVASHRRLGGRHGLAGIDAVIGDWAIRNQISIWHSTPSLVQHIGNVSTIWENSGANGLRRASRFVDDEFQD